MTGFSHCSALLTEICNLIPGAAAQFSKQQLGGLHWSLALLVHYRPVVQIC